MEARNIEALFVVTFDVVHEDVMVKDHAASSTIHGAEESLWDALVVLHFELDHHGIFGFGLFGGIGGAVGGASLLCALCCKVSRLIPS